MKKTYKVTSRDIKGRLKTFDFPLEVVERIVECQVEQGNKPDLSHYQEYRYLAKKNEGGFDWENTVEGKKFWEEILVFFNYKIFFDRYPRKYTILEVTMEDIAKKFGVDPSQIRIKRNWEDEED
jgi:hypothetical protein